MTGERSHVFEFDQEAAALYDRKTAMAARFEWLTGRSPEVVGETPDTSGWPEEAVELLPRWRAVKDAHEARLRKTDRARLSRFQGGVFDSEDEECAARLWWSKRY